MDTHPDLEPVAHTNSYRGVIDFGIPGVESHCCLAICDFRIKLNLSVRNLSYTLQVGHLPNDT